MAIEGAQRLDTQPGDTPITGVNHLAQVPAGVRVAVVRPGDTLIVSLNDVRSPAQINDMRRDLGYVLRDSVRVVIFDVGIDVTVVRPDAAA